MIQMIQTGVQHLGAAIEEKSFFQKQGDPLIQIVQHQGQTVGKVGSPFGSFGSP